MEEKYINYTFYSSSKTKAKVNLHDCDLHGWLNGGNKVNKPQLIKYLNVITLTVQNMNTNFMCQNRLIRRTFFHQIIENRGCSSVQVEKLVVNNA